VQLAKVLLLLEIEFNLAFVGCLDVCRLQPHQINLALRLDPRNRVIILCLSTHITHSSFSTAVCTWAYVVVSVAHVCHVAAFEQSELLVTLDL